MNCFSFPYKRFPVLGTQKWLSFAKTTEQQRKTYINASGTDKKSKNVQASVSKWCVAKTNTAIIHQATIVVPENMHGHVVAAVLSLAQRPALFRFQYFLRWVSVLKKRPWGRRRESTVNLSTAEKYVTVFYIYCITTDFLPYLWGWIYFIPTDPIDKNNNTQRQ